MALDVERLLKEMVSGAAAVLATASPEIRRYAEAEFRRLAKTLVRIEAQKAAGEIAEDVAQLLVDAQKDAMRTVLNTAQGLALVATERAINAALAAIRDPVQKALGWALL